LIHLAIWLYFNHLIRNQQTRDEILVHFEETRIEIPEINGEPWFEHAGVEESKPRYSATSRSFALTEAA